MMKRLGVFCAATIVFMAMTTVAYAHYLAYSAVDDQGTNEVMHYAVDPSASSIQGKINNAVTGADSWNRLDCYYDGACSGVKWEQVTLTQAQAMDDALVIKAEPTSPTGTNLYGVYQHRDGSYDDVTMYLDVMTRYSHLKQSDMVLHETGHALGLAHAPCTIGSSVMVTGCFNGLGHPGKHDKTDYKTLWITGDGPSSLVVPSGEEGTESVPTPDGFIIYDYGD